MRGSSASSSPAPRISRWRDADRDVSPRGVRTCYDPFVMAELKVLQLDDRVARPLKTPAATLGSQALNLLLDGAQDGLIHIADDETLVASALMLAISLKHRVPDCMYLALAEREGAALATADARLASLAKARGVDVWKVPAA